jgi:hypothetical protein
MPVVIFGEAGGGDLLNAEAVGTPVDDEPWEKGSLTIFLGPQK